MKTWIKIAAGLLGGLAIIASLGGFSRKKNTEPTYTEPEEQEIPDDIFDGNRYPSPRKKADYIQNKNEQNIRGFQEGLAKASNILGHICIICNSVVKMMYEDPCVRVTPTTYIM